MKGHYFIFSKTVNSKYGPTTGPFYGTSNPSCCYTCLQPPEQ